MLYSWDYINKQWGEKGFLIFFSSKVNSGLSHLSEALVKSTWHLPLEFIETHTLNNSGSNCFC